MSRIDVTHTPALITLYFERIEEHLGGWRCHHCKTAFVDTIPFGPPPVHDCSKLNCSWCGDKSPGSHGICPTHFVEQLPD